MAELARMYGVSDPPDVDIVDEISPDASGMRVLADCLGAHGWPVELDGDVMEIASIPDEQLEAFNLDQYICDAQHPVAQKHLPASQEEQLSKWYGYLTSTYVPCVEELGYSISEAPSWESFLASQGMNWVPAAEVGAAARGDQPFAEIDKRCPQQIPIDS